MPVRKDNKIGAWISALREWWPSARGQLREWWDEVRENPVLLWQTDAVRYGAYGAGLLVVIIVVMGVVAGLQPPPPKGGGERANTAFFDVLCTEPECGHHFAIQRKLKFDDFPVRCPKCGKESGYHAMRVTSGPNRGRWVVRNRE